MTLKDCLFYFIYLLLSLFFGEIIHRERIDLACDRSKYPVTSPRGVAEERQSKNEEFVSQCQVPDVVVANGAVTYRGVARYDVQHEGVAG